MNSATIGPIELRDVTKSYREGDERHLVLQGVSQSFGQGEIVVLLGRSGSGKSTLLNLLAGIDLPDEGDVLIAGRAVNRMTETERTLLRRRIGFVFQSFNLIPTLTVAENLLLPLELAEGRLDSADRGRAADLLARVGLADRSAAFPDRLSGGEQQRVALARALIHRPHLLLADEPTGNLDRETGRDVLSLIEQLSRESGRTLVMATHSREAALLADRVFQIENHRLEEVALS